MILQNEHFMMKEQTRVKYKELASGENISDVQDVDDAIEVRVARGCIGDFESTVRYSVADATVTTSEGAGDARGSVP